MPMPARLRRIDPDHDRRANPFVFIVRFGPGRWPRVPPWRPRPPLAPPPVDSPLPHPDAGAPGLEHRPIPALSAPNTPETSR